MRQYLGEVFRKLAEQKESWIEEGHLMSDHVPMMMSILPKYAMSRKPFHASVATGCPNSTPSVCNTVASRFARAETAA